MTIRKCVCCCKQIVTYRTSEDDRYITTKEGAVFMGSGEWCCGYCSKDLDEWGLFPEERHLAPELYSR